MVLLIPVLLIAAFPTSDGAAGQAPKDALLRGIKQLAVVVDTMDDADAKCGLTQNAVQSAASKTLTDNGLAVSATRADFQPFLYVRTTSLRTSEGECITHVLTTVRAYVSPPHLAWTPEQPALSLEVVLQEQGGLVFSPDASAHGQSTEGALRRYVERIATAIKAANK